MLSYKDFRAAGYTAQQAKDMAEGCTAFAELEDAGLARIRSEFDDDVDVSWMDKRQREEWDGEAYGTIAEVRADEDSEWEHVDSCWGHIGYRDVLDPLENVYVADHMRACVAWHAEREAQELQLSGANGAD